MGHPVSWDSKKYVNICFFIVNLKKRWASQGLELSPVTWLLCVLGQVVEALSLNIFLRRTDYTLLQGTAVWLS